VLILENNYHVDFRPDHSICSLLGFNHDLYTDEVDVMVHLPAHSAILV